MLIKLPSPTPKKDQSIGISITQKEDCVSIIINQLSSLGQQWWHRGSVLAYGAEDPRVEWILFRLKELKWKIHSEFSTSALRHLPWTSGLSSLISFFPTFSIFHFLFSFASLTPIFFIPYNSLLNSYASCSNSTNGLCYSVSVQYHCLCWDPAIRTKLVSARLKRRQKTTTYFQRNVII